MSVMKPGEPYYEVRRQGRWSWYITVHDGGMCQWGPDGGGWFAMGHARAVRKAKRKLASFVRWQARRSEVESGR